MALDDLAAQQAALSPPVDPNAPGAPAPSPSSFRPFVTTPPPGVTPQPVKTTPQSGNNVMPWWNQEQPPQVFIPASPNRAPREWKDPSWQNQSLMNYPGRTPGGADTPAPFETYGVLRGTGSSMSRWGSPSVAFHSSQVGSMAMGFAPILDLISSGQFSKNYNAAQLGRLHLQQQVMLNNAKMAQLAHQQQAEAYGGILEEAALGAISPDDAEQRIGEYARSQGDNTLLEILHNKGLGAATRFLQWRDAQMQDMLAGATALRKATGTKDSEDLAAAWGEQSGGTGGGYQRYPMIPGSEPAPPPQRGPPTASGADPTATAAAAQTDATAPPEEDADKYFEDLKKGDPQHGQPALSDQELNAAKAVADGQPSEGYNDLIKQGQQGRQYKAKIDAAANAIHGKMMQIARDPRYKSSDDRLIAMSSFVPATAARLRGFLSYDADLDKEGIKNGRDQDRATLLMMNPHWNENGFKIKAEYNQQNKPSALAMSRGNSLVQAQEDLGRSLKRVPLDEPIPFRWADLTATNYWTGDPRYADIVTNIINVTTDTIALQTGSSRPPVTLIHDRVSKMLATMSPSQILVQLQDDARAGYGRLMGYNDTFRSAVGDPKAFAPGYNKLTDDRYRSFILMNPYTQTMPADALPSAFTGNRPIGSEKLPSWVRKGIDDYTPLRLQDVDQARQFVNDPKYKNSTDPKVQAQLAHLRKLLGPLADPDPFDYVGSR